LQASEAFSTFYLVCLPQFFWVLLFGSGESLSFKRVKTRGAPEWLYQRHLKHSSGFWIRYRKGGVRLEEPLKGDSSKAAAECGQDLLAKALRTNTEGKHVALVRCEHLCDEIVSLKRGKSASTHEGNEIMSRVHVKPYLNDFCPYISDLNSATWEHYKVHKRLENPTVALFNHWKFFLNLGKYAKQKGLITERIAFSFDAEKEDFREEGMIIPEEHFSLIVKHANQVWKDRAVMQHDTGMRPGEVRRLQKDRVEFLGDHAIIRLRKEDTKTRTAREFIVRSIRVLEVLRRRMGLESTFFFPSRSAPEEAMDKCLKGWQGAIARANEEFKEAGKPLMPTRYTPHDLRHTYATREFKRSNAQTAVICFQLGMSLEEADKTYLHFKAADTAELAERLAMESALVRA
jgi:hypothetical protein